MVSITWSVMAGSMIYCRSTQGKRYDSIANCLRYSNASEELMLCMGADGIRIKIGESFFKATEPTECKKFVAMSGGASECYGWMYLFTLHSMIYLEKQSHSMIYQISESVHDNRNI